MKINFDKVKLFQEIFDTVSEKPNFDKLDLRYDLIYEELQELKEAYENNDIVELVDAYCDILYLTIGGVYKNGLQGVFERCFDNVCDSNLSKADNSFEDAEKTQELYASKGVESVIKEVAPGIFVNYRLTDGKVLKSHRWQEPVIKDILCLN